ncbi:MAG: hypothetical protein NVSMB47_09290 [Polyangiales bacterium]
MIAGDAHEGGQVTSTPRPVRARSKLQIRLVVFSILGLLAAVLILPKVPREQRMRLHFGVGSSHVVRATARVGRDGAWDRESTWRFERGAPASVEWTFALPNGEADVEVELSSATSSAQSHQRVDLRGGETSLELAEPTRGLP